MSGPFIIAKGDPPPHPRSEFLTHSAPLIQRRGVEMRFGPGCQRLLNGSMWPRDPLSAADKADPEQQHLSPATLSHVPDTAVTNTRGGCLSETSRVFHCSTKMRGPQKLPLSAPNTVSR